MSKILALLATLMSVCVIVNSDVVPLSLPKYIEDAVVVFEEAIAVQGEIEYVVRGTGFIVKDKEREVALLVTNRHVLENRDPLYVRFNTLDGESRRLRARLRRSDGSPLWIAHQDSGVDVAALPKPKGLDTRAIYNDRFKPLSEVRLGDEVYFIGFPLLAPEAAAFAGKEKNYPMIRFGVVSYISREDVHSIRDPDVPAGGDDTVIDNAVRFSFLFYLENYINLTVNLGFDKYGGQDLVTTFTTGIRVDVW